MQVELLVVCDSLNIGEMIVVSFSSAKVYDYLLEKYRVVQHGPGERTFHFFYYLFAGLEKEALEYFYLDDPETYRYGIFIMFCIYKI
jgi:myosin heavy subunit